MAEPEQNEALEEDTSGANAGYRTFSSSPERGEAVSTPEAGEPGEEPSEEEGLGPEGEEFEEEAEPEEEEEDPEGDEEGADHGLPKVSAELEEERKQLIAAATEKFKGVAALRLKASLVDAIQQNPEATIRDLAQRYGVQLGGAPAQQQQEDTYEFKAVDIEPKQDESISDFMKRLMGGYMSQLPGMMKAQTPSAKGPAKGPAAQAEGGLSEAEIAGSLRYLDSKYKDWPLYEETMVALLTKHPTYVNDLDSLYKTANATSVNTTDRINAKKNKQKKPSTGVRPKKRVTVRTGKGRKMSFNQAWNAADRELSSGGG